MKTKTLLLLILSLLVFTNCNNEPKSNNNKKDSNTIEKTENYETYEKAHDFDESSNEAPDTIEITIIKDAPIFEFNEERSSIIGKDEYSYKYIRKGTKLKVYKYDNYDYNDIILCDDHFDYLYTIYDPYQDVEDPTDDVQIFGSFTSLSQNRKLEDVYMPDYLINRLNKKTNQKKFKDFINENDGFYYIIKAHSGAFYIHINNLTQNELAFSYFGNRMESPCCYCNNEDLKSFFLYLFNDTIVYSDKTFISVDTPPYQYIKEKNIGFYEMENNLVYRGKYNFNNISATFHDEFTEKSEPIPKEIIDYEKKLSNKTFTIIYISGNIPDNNPKMNSIFYFYVFNDKWYLAAIEIPEYTIFGDCP